MLTIPLAFFQVMLELSVGSFLVLYLLDIRNDTSINFVRFQGILYLLMFTLLAWFTMQGFARSDQLQHNFLYNLDFGWLKYQGSALLWFMLLQIPYNIFLYSQRQRPLRLFFGGAVSLLGLFSLFAVGMGFRSVAAANLGGTFTVLSFVSGALALGGVSTAMLLGHWYLNTPTASGKPLEFATALTIGGIVAQIAFGILAGPVTYHPLPKAIPAATVSHMSQSTALTHASSLAVHAVIQPKVIAANTTATPTAGQSVPKPSVPTGVSFNQLTLVLIEYIVGLGLPLVMSAIALYLVKDRSFQSATGMLYIAVVFAFFGEILARNLFLQPLMG